MHRVRQVLGEALTAEDDAAVLQELEELESIETREEAAQLPAAPKVPVLHACNNPAHHFLTLSMSMSACVQPREH